MRSLQRHKRKRTGLRLGVLVVVLFFIVVASFGVTPPMFLQQALHTVGLPLWRARAAGLESATDALEFRTRRQLIDENERLQDEVEALRASLVEFEKLQEENAALREALDLAPVASMRSVEVVVPVGFSLGDTMVISGGRDDGVRKGDRIFADATTAIGVVHQVFARSSTVALYSNSGRKTQSVLPASGTTGEVEGVGTGNMTMQVPKDVEVAVGELVLATGGGRPVIGVVGEIVTAPTEAFQELVFRAPVTIADLDFVFVSPTYVPEDSM